MQRTFRAGLFATIGASLISFTPAAAQLGKHVQLEGPPPVCEPSGYAKPRFGYVNRNSGDGDAPTEDASPCIPPEVMTAANAVGMARSWSTAPTTVKGLITLTFAAEGSFTDSSGKLQTGQSVDFHVHYGMPGARLMVGKVGGPKQIVAFNDATSWTEATEGGAANASPGRARELLIMTKLLPFGGLWTAAEAEAHVKVTKEQGKTVLEGVSPYDGINVKTVLDDKSRPESITVTDGADVYTARFADYTDGFEPAYLFIFPKKIVWTKNGKPYADLTVTAYKSNPYVVVPVPKNVEVVEAPRPKFPVSGPGYVPPAKRVSPFRAHSQHLVSDKPTPRTPDGKPDLEGYWGHFPSGHGLENRVPGWFEADQAALQRASGWEKPIYKPELWEKVRANDFSKIDVDPGYSCMPAGVPRQNAPSRIIVHKDEVLLFNGPYFNPQFSRTRSAVFGYKFTEDDLDMALFEGLSSAHWDGDTLVIETVGFNDITWLQWQGYFHSDKMKVTERFWRKGDYLYYNYTVDDPEVLVEPWTQETLVRMIQPSRYPRVIEAAHCVPRPPEGDLYLRG